MEELYNIGISETTIKNMLEINPEIKEMTTDEIIKKKLVLKEVNCNDIQILNIISSNPMFLSRTNSDVVKLLNYLLDIGFETLNILFDSNPYILNLDVFEIEDYIVKRRNNGEQLEDIIDDMDSNPYLFSEI